MAERVPDCDAKERLKRLKEKQKMKTIRKAQRPWLQFGQLEPTKKGFSPDIVSYDAEELALKLGKFF